jgi:hypothetical protein
MIYGDEDQNVARNLTQDSTISHDIPIFAPTSPINAPNFYLAVAADQFDNVVFEEEEHNQDHEISLGSKDQDDGASLECDEKVLTCTFKTNQIEHPADYKDCFFLKERQESYPLY